MDIKNLNHKVKAKLNKTNVKTFFRKQGIYVLIFLCVAAAGVTALLTWPKEPAAPGDNGAGASVIDAPRLSDELAAKTSPQPSPVLSPAPQVSPEQTKEPAAGTSSGSVKLKKPADGQIINPFSGNELVFFPSLNMWKTHNGIDIKADKDAPVNAALSGTVFEVYTNEADGGVVVISHSEKSKTVYAGLGDIHVKAGDKVNAGKQIGLIGEMPKELDLSYHLHFEYIVDGAYKDPVRYF